MPEKTNVQINNDLYQKLVALVGAEHVSEFLESLVLSALPYAGSLTEDELAREYQAMAADEDREAEAREWCKPLVGDCLKSGDHD